jgi:hypothetical protein
LLTTLEPVYPLAFREVFLLRHKGLSLVILYWMRFQKRQESLGLFARPEDDRGWRLRMPMARVIRQRHHTAAYPD